MAMAEDKTDKWIVAIDGGADAFPCRSDQNLLAAMINARQTSIKVGCRNGGCGICRIQVTNGQYESQKMTRSRISESDEAAGIVLACRISPRSDIALMPLPLVASQGVVT
jgi:ferredoxin